MKSKHLLKKKQHRLANLINLTLAQSYDRTDANDKRASKHRLRYYQGYHDVACIFLHALGGAGSKEPVYGRGVLPGEPQGELEGPLQVGEGEAEGAEGPGEGGGSGS